LGWPHRAEKAGKILRIFFTAIALDPRVANFHLFWLDFIISSGWISCARSRPHDKRFGIKCRDRDRQESPVRSPRGVAQVAGCRSTQPHTQCTPASPKVEARGQREGCPPSLHQSTKWSARARAPHAQINASLLALLLYFPVARQTHPSTVGPG